MNNKALRVIARSLPLIIILIVAIFFRLHNLTTTPPGLYPDEAMNGNNALEAIASHDFKVFYPENNGREGLFINLQAFVIMATGMIHEPWVLRLVSALFGIATIVGAYCAVKQMLKKYSFANYAALASAFFMAISFWHVNFSRIGFRAIMAPFFMIGALYLLSYALEQLNEKSNPRVGWTLLALGGIVYGLGMHSYIAYRATPLIIIFFFCAYWLLTQRASFKKLFVQASVFVLFSLVVFAPLGIYFAQNPSDFLGRTSQVSVASSSHPFVDFLSNCAKTVGMFFWQGDGNWRHNYNGAPQLYWIVGALFALGFFYAARLLNKKAFAEKKDEVLFWWTMICWLVVASLPVVISNEGIPHALRSILMIPPVFCMAGAAVARFRESAQSFVSRKYLLDIGLGCIALIMVFQAYHQYFILWGENQNTKDAFDVYSVTLGHTLNGLPKETPKYIVVNQGGVLVRDVPMPSQTVMFITDSFTSQKQQEKNIRYVLEKNEASIPKDASHFYLDPKKQ